jgi:hypothetical protein
MNRSTSRVYPLEFAEALRQTLCQVTRLRGIGDPGRVGYAR